MDRAKRKDGRRVVIRRERWVICLIALTSLLVHCARPVRVGEPAPGFTLAGLDGSRVQAAEMKGRVWLLHFWATWCPPCLKELPELIRFSKTLDPRKILVFPVCVDAAPPAEIKDFLEAWGFDVPVYLDPGGAVANKYGTFRYPETYVIDAQGIVRRKIIGPGDWKSPEWAQFLQKVG